MLTIRDWILTKILRIMKDFVSFCCLFVFLYIYAKQGQKQLFWRLCVTVVYLVSRLQIMLFMERNYGI